MGELVHTIHSRIVKDQGVIRRGYIENFPEPVRYGMHAAIKKLYGMQSPEELPATLDHIVTAVAA
jgi:hypothetical protein